MAAPVAAPMAADVPELAQRLVNDVRERVNFIGVMAAAGQDRKAIIIEQVSTLVSEFRNYAGVDMPTVTTVTMELNRGPWSESQRAAMASALNEARQHGAVRGGRRSQGGSGGARSQQQMPHIHHFFTPSDWAYFQDESIAVKPKVEHMATRLFRVGCTCPSESIKKRALGILMAIGMPRAQAEGASAEMKRQWMVDLGETIKRLDDQTAWPGQHIKRFPMVPADLPPSVREYAYPNADDQPTAPPAVITMQYLDAFERATAYRGTHKELRSSPSPLGALLGGHQPLALTNGAVAASSSGGDLQSALAQYALAQLLGKAPPAPTPTAPTEANIHLLNAAPKSVRRSVSHGTLSTSTLVPGGGPIIEDVAEDSPPATTASPPSTTASPTLSSPLAPGGVPLGSPGVPHAGVPLGAVLMCPGAGAVPLPDGPPGAAPLHDGHFHPDDGHSAEAAAADAAAAALVAATSGGSGKANPAAKVKAGATKGGAKAKGGKAKAPPSKAPPAKAPKATPAKNGKGKAAAAGAKPAGAKRAGAKPAGAKPAGAKAGAKASADGPLAAAVSGGQGSGHLPSSSVR